MPLLLGVTVSISNHINHTEVQFFLFPCFNKRKINNFMPVTDESNATFRS